MRLPIDAACGLVVRVMRGLGHDAAEAAIIADHLIDCELRGLAYGGLARAVSIVERFEKQGGRRRPITVVRETPVSARLDGGDNIGYVVAERATRMAIAKARATGIAVVGANDTWYTGMLSVFAEMAAAEDMVSMIVSNATPWVAPHGGGQGRFGTNPICFGLPADGDPIIWDIGTSAIMHAEVILARRRGERLPEGVCFDADGAPTRDPDAALAGAFAAWGGYKGSGLGLVVQMLGGLAGSPMLPPNLAGFGFLILVMQTGLMMDPAEYRAAVSAYADSVRATRPVPGGPPVRMPFDRSAAERRRRLAEGHIEVDPAIHARLTAAAGG